MEKNWQMATNDELKKYAEELENEFNSAQKQLLECYDRMTKSSEEYIKIKSIINKRNGVKDEQ